MSKGRVILDGNNYFGIGMNFPMIFNDGFRNPGFFKIEYTHIFKNVLARPFFSFNPIGDSDQDCVTVNEKCTHFHGDEYCTGDTTCTKEGRKTIGGGLDIGIIANRWNETYLAFGVEPEIGKYFSAKGNDHPNVFLNGAAFVELGFAIGYFHSSVRAFGGVQYEMGDRDEVFPLVGLACIFGAGGPTESEEINTKSEETEESKPEKPVSKPIALTEEELALLIFLGNELFKDPKGLAESKMSVWNVDRLGALKRLAVVKWKQMIIKKIGLVPEEYKTPVTFEEFAKALGLKPDAALQEINEKVEAVIREHPAP